MSQQHFSEPPSILARRKDGDGPKKQTREEYRKAKELEELRKQGNAPAEVDESGKDINPHIPKYMVDVPWYVTYDRALPTLKHQRHHEEQKKTFDGMDKWYSRGGPSSDSKKTYQPPKVQTKFKTGSCENCGARGHLRKDCLERPRKRLAKYGAAVLAPDDQEHDHFQLSFEGKRDRWNGVDMEIHQDKIRANFEKLEEARREIKTKNLEETDEKTTEDAAAKKERKKKSGAGDSDDEDDEEFKYAEEMELPSQKTQLEGKQRISVRNLRIREDTAKYLLNLDPQSAYYDPKSRSMRGNPLEHKAESTNIPYVGDNYVRYSGQADKFNHTQIFAWEAYEKGVDVHVQAEPTKLEMLHAEFKQRYEQCAKSIKSDVLEKYGGAEHLTDHHDEKLEAQQSGSSSNNSAGTGAATTSGGQRALIFGQTENYAEYNRFGNVVKQQERAKKSSKYVENEFRNSHTSVWGSFYSLTEHKWGYKCCESLDRNSYCKGKGKEKSPKKVEKERENKDDDENDEGETKEVECEERKQKKEEEKKSAKKATPEKEKVKVSTTSATTTVETEDKIKEKTDC